MIQLCVHLSSMHSNYAIVDMRVCVENMRVSDSACAPYSAHTHPLSYLSSSHDCVSCCLWYSDTAEVAVKTCKLIIGASRAT